MITKTKVNKKEKRKRSTAINVIVSLNTDKNCKGLIKLKIIYL